MAQPNEIAVQIGKLLNGPSRIGEVGKEIALKEHRYLQQQFWTLCEGFIQQAAKDKAEGRFDDRNAYTVKICARIQENLDVWRQEIANEF